MLTSTTENGITTLKIDRPEQKNALNPQVVQAIIAGLKEAEKDESVRAVIFTSAPPLFTSGMDVSVFQNPKEPANKILIDYQVREMFDAFIAFPKPIIGAINGVGVGFGLTVLGHFDIVIMSDKTKFSIPFSSLGIGPEACASYTLPTMLGRQKANWLLYSGDWISAQDCLEAGLALAVVSEDQVYSEALKHAEVIASKSLTSIMATKELLMAPHRDALYEANRYEMKLFAEMLEGAATKEGTAAFFEKRAPRFRELGL